MERFLIVNKFIFVFYCFNFGLRVLCKLLFIKLKVNISDKIVKFGMVIS